MDKPNILGQQEFQEKVAIMLDENTLTSTTVLQRPEMGFLKMERTNIAEGLNIISISGTMSCPLQIDTDVSEPWVGMLFQLQGQMNSVMDNQRTVEVNKGRFNLLRETGEASRHTFIPEQGYFGALNFDLTQSFFLRLLELNEEHFAKLHKLASGTSPFIASPVAMMFGGKINVLLQAIKACPFQGRMKNTFLEAKFIELLSETNSRAFRTNKKDVDIFYAIRDFLDENYNEDLHLLKIARQFGINDFKLKKGFKETFGKTVFNYLIEKRLTIAQELILNTGCAITEISEKVGYKTQAHFATAFKKQFGYSPSNLR